MRARQRHVIHFGVMLCAFGGCDIASFPAPSTESDAVVAPSASTPTATSQSSSFGVTIRDVGELIQGELVTETFEFQNAYQEPLSVVAGASDCACTKLAVPDQPLPPGEIWHATVTIDTSRLTGPFAHGGTIQTRTPSGRRIDHQVSVHGTSMALLDFSPGIVECDDSSVPALVELEGRIPIAWDHVHLACTSDRVTTALVPIDDTRARLEISGSAPPGVPKMHAEVLVTLTRQSTEHDRPAATHQLAIPVYVKQEVDLAVFPQGLSLSADQAETTVSFLFLGRRVSRELGVPECICEGFEVLPRFKKTEGTGDKLFARWQLTFRAFSPDQLPDSTSLHIQFDGQEPLTVPVRVLRHENRIVPLSRAPRTTDGLK